MLAENAVFGQLVEVAGGRGSAHVQLLLQEFNAGIGVAKQVVEQVLAVKLVGAQPFPGGLHQRAHLPNQHNALAGRLFHAGEHVQQPGFPGAGVAHGLQVVVIVGFVVRDEPAEVEHRDIEQAFQHQVQNVENAAGAAVAVVKRMDAFELKVQHGHFHQVVDIVAGVVVEVLFQIGHQVQDDGCILRRGINDFASLILQTGTGQLAVAALVAF